MNKKNCKICWSEFICYNTIQNKCNKCVLDLQKQKWIKQTSIKIKQVSTKNKNTIAKFSSEIKAEILIRDKHCIFCSNPITDHHHIFYWWQAEHWPDRNEVNKWVWLCRLHHEKIHHFTDWTSQQLRQDCINYLNNFYKKNNL